MTVAVVDILSCPGCSAPLPATHYNSGARPCPGCGATGRAEVFPALYVPPSASAAPEADAGEAACFHHPGRRAASVCGACGCFVCTLCEVKLGEKTLCPSCVARGVSPSADLEFPIQRTLYDRVALALAVLPLLFIFVTVVTAPATLYVAIRHWKSPGSVIPRTKFRLVIAIILASLQITGWIAVLVKSLT